MKNHIWALIVFLFMCQGCALERLPYEHITNIYTPLGENVICFGDSLTEGVGANKGEDYPSILQNKLSIKVINAGKSGDTTYNALDRLDKVLEQSPKVVIVELGANDFLASFKGGFAEADESDVKTFQNLNIIVNKIQNAGAVVVIAGVHLNRKYESGYKKLAKETGSLLVPDIMDGIFNDPKLMSADNRHPNALGYQKMADKMSDVLEPLLQYMK